MSKLLNSMDVPSTGQAVSLYFHNKRALMVGRGPGCWCCSRRELQLEDKYRNCNGNCSATNGNIGR